MHRPSASNVASVNFDSLLLKTPQPLFCIGFGSANRMELGAIREFFFVFHDQNEVSAKISSLKLTVNRVDNLPSATFSGGCPFSPFRRRFICSAKCVISASIIGACFEKTCNNFEVRVPLSIASNCKVTKLLNSMQNKVRQKFSYPFCKNVIRLAPSIDKSPFERGSEKLYTISFSAILLTTCVTHELNIHSSHFFSLFSPLTFVFQ